MHYQRELFLPTLEPFIAFTGGAAFVAGGERSPLTHQNKVSGSCHGVPSVYEEHILV